MSLWKIAWRSIEQRGLASALTALSMALGVTLVVAVLVIYGVIGDSFKRNSGLGYNMIVGAKGGKLQLVLNTVFYLSAPIENIPWDYYQEFVKPGGKFTAYVERAVPVCLGDYYQDYRVVGTTPLMFDNFEYMYGHKYEFSSGRNFKQEDFFDAVVGATVARNTGLKVGDTFNPTHGAPGGKKHDEDSFKVTGILAPTGTPNDRAVFVNMEGFYLLAGHAKPVEKTEASDKNETKPAETKPSDTPAAEADKAEPATEGEKKESCTADEKPADEAKPAAAGDAHQGEHKHREPLPDDQREVTAILVRNSDFYTALIKNVVNEGNVAQAVLPIAEIANLFSVIVNPMRIVLLALTIMIVVVSGISILVSIYNSMSERRHEIAVMRALGAGRRTVMAIVLFESILLSLAGGLAGWLMGHLLIAVLNPYLTAQTGVSIGFLHLVPFESVIIPGLVILASVVGFLPAMSAYGTDVAKALSESP